MEYQFSNHIWVELLLSINSSEVYWQSSYCSRIIKNTFIICQTRKREAERQAGSERPLPPEQMMGEQPGITGCLATERFPRDSKQWEGVATKWTTKWMRSGHHQGTIWSQVNLTLQITATRESEVDLKLRWLKHTIKKKNNDKQQCRKVHVKTK